MSKFKLQNTPTFLFHNSRVRCYHTNRWGNMGIHCYGRCTFFWWRCFSFCNFNNFFWRVRVFDFGALVKHFDFKRKFRLFAFIYYIFTFFVFNRALVFVIDTIFKLCFFFFSKFGRCCCSSFRIFFTFGINSFNIFFNLRCNKIVSVSITLRFRFIIAKVVHQLVGTFINEILTITLTDAAFIRPLI